MTLWIVHPAKIGWLCLGDTCRVCCIKWRDCRPRLETELWYMTCVDWNSHSGSISRSRRYGLKLKSIGCRPRSNLVGDSAWCDNGRFSSWEGCGWEKTTSSGAEVSSASISDISCEDRGIVVMVGWAWGAGLVGLGLVLAEECSKPKLYCQDSYPFASFLHRILVDISLGCSRFYVQWLPWSVKRWICYASKCSLL